MTRTVEAPNKINAKVLKVRKLRYIYMVMVKSLNHTFNVERGSMASVLSMAEALVDSMILYRNLIFIPNVRDNFVRFDQGGY